jgi:hypothetical protein
LLYSKIFHPEQKLSKDDNYDNLVFDKQDPAKIASQFFALIKMTDLMYEEYRDEYPEALERDSNAKTAFDLGFTSYKSDSVDYLLEHNKELSCSLVLFYSQAETQEQIMRILAFKLMEVFCIKNEKKLKDQVQSLSISDKQTMDNAIPIILEDVSDLGLSGVGFV